MSAQRGGRGWSRAHVEWKLSMLVSFDPGLHGGDKVSYPNYPLKKKKKTVMNTNTSELE